MTDAERDEIIIEIATTLDVIKTQMKDVDRTLYGNGHPGLVRDCQELATKVQFATEQAKEVNTLFATIQVIESRIKSIEEKSKGHKDWIKWVITTLLALYAVFKQ